MIRVALGATAFRGISVLVASFCALVFHTAAAPEPLAGAFGVYPLLTHEVGRWIGRWLASPITPGLVVSWIAFAGAMVMLLLVSQLDLDEDKSEGAVLLAMVFPFAFVFGRADADALFLLFALAAFYGFRQRWWVVGGLCGAVATATLPGGVLMLPALAWTGWRQADGGTSDRARIGVAFLLAACGFGGYLLYVYYRGGPPGGWAASMDRWGYHVGQAPWTSLQHLLTSHAAPADGLNGAVALIGFVAVPVVWWRFDGGYALYMLAMLWMPLVSGKYDDMGRASALLFPVFILIAGMRWRIIFVAVAVTSAMFYALGLAMFP